MAKKRFSPCCKNRNPLFYGRFEPLQIRFWRLKSELVKVQRFLQRDGWGHSATTAHPSGYPSPGGEFTTRFFRCGSLYRRGYLTPPQRLEVNSPGRAVQPSSGALPQASRNTAKVRAMSAGRGDSRLTRRPVMG